MAPSESPAPFPIESSQHPSSTCCCCELLREVDPAPASAPKPCQNCATPSTLPSTLHPLLHQTRPPPDLHQTSTRPPPDQIFLRLPCAAPCAVECSTQSWSEPRSRLPGHDLSGRSQCSRVPARQYCADPRGPAQFKIPSRYLCHILLLLLQTNHF